MNVHFEQGPGSVSLAARDVTGAELPAAIRPASEAGLRQRTDSVPTCTGRAFSHQDVIDYQEWVASGEFK